MEEHLSRRRFLKASAMMPGALAVDDPRGIAAALAAPKNGSRVFFTKDINADGLLKIYDRVRQDITGKTGIKVHTGEPQGPNILPRDMVKALQQRIPNSNLVETNTLKKGKRYATADHRETIKINGWDFCSVRTGYALRMP